MLPSSSATCSVHPSLKRISEVLQTRRQQVPYQNLDEAMHGHGFRGKVTKRDVRAGNLVSTTQVKQMLRAGGCSMLRAFTIGLRASFAEQRAERRETAAGLDTYNAGTKRRDRTMFR